ncbi:serine/threonine-protein kinase [Stigmatella sp. ncwal1]|uniref:Serine/threonine-protein kinase n=1 Tax=Stigmatella ashevillensis TaxID=2995309 RepID=A0ABT5DF83_9BACT|nr:serine/threonine-protein kinase [Stigmatella ashevillena]MDC0712332.1 serine/threonine-protein kinase [Stigmatella ashevillena]
MLEPASLPPGTDIGPWRVLSQRGRGSYGVVYRVEKAGHPEAGVFALKLALYHKDPRFEREGELLSRLRHPHVPRLHSRDGWVHPSGVVLPYLVMEWVEGAPLYAWAVQHGLTSRQALRFLAQVARALEATHAVEGVHRDVKGDNVLVRHEGTQAVLMDLGSGNYRGAHVLTHQPPPPGTPQYQSPECLRFQWEHLREPMARYEARPADDLYALGVMAYRLTMGAYPPEPMAVVTTEEGSRLVPAERPLPEQWGLLCPELAALIQRMLLDEPAGRGFAGELAEALENAARTAGPGADAPIFPGPAQAPAPRKARSFPVRRVLAGAQWLGTVVALALCGERVGHWLSDESAFSVVRGGTSGLAETVIANPVGAVPPISARGGIGLEIPKKPLPGQRRPPCGRPKIEINGGCWLELLDVAPPCDAESYLYKGKCYEPLGLLSRPETSGQRR